MHPAALLLIRAMGLPGLSPVLPAFRHRLCSFNRLRAPWPAAGRGMSFPGETLTPSGSGSGQGKAERAPGAAVRLRPAGSSRACGVWPPLGSAGAGLRVLGTVMLSFLVSLADKELDGTQT